MFAVEWPIRAVTNVISGNKQDHKKAGQSRNVKSALIGGVTKLSLKPRC